MSDGRKDGRGVLIAVVAISVVALSISAFALSVTMRETLQLKEQVDHLQAEIEALEGAQAEAGHGGNDVELQPTVEFTLMAYLTGFVGVGGDIDGVTNPTLYVSPGDVVKVTVINGEDVEHDFVIDELGAHSEHLPAEGSQDDVIFVAPKVGTFYYYCSVPGHRELGMEGTLEVVG